MEHELRTTAERKYNDIMERVYSFAVEKLQLCVGHIV